MEFCLSDGVLRKPISLLLVMPLNISSNFARLIELQAFICEFVENFEFAPLPGVDIRRAVAEVMTPMVKGKEHEGTQLPLLVSLVE
jgi:hypothetical protein